MWVKLWVDFLGDFPAGDLGPEVVRVGQRLDFRPAGLGRRDMDRPFVRRLRYQCPGRRAGRLCEPRLRGVLLLATLRRFCERGLLEQCPGYF